MKFSKNKSALAITAALAVGVAGVANLAVAGIADTKHNLGSSNTVTGGNDNVNSGTGQICVFCHTPHGTNTSAPVPLWNKALPTDMSVYQTYDQLGTSSLEGGVTSVGSVSLACLSCHDGTQAMDNMMNAPGSGNTALAVTDWSGAGVSATTGKLNTTNMANLARDLTNDHPVGIQYCGGGIVAGKTEADCVDIGFQTGVLVEDAIDSLPVWWVDTEATPNGTRQKTDMPLFTRTDLAGDGTAQPFVECASCHDPHTETPLFLRIDNTGSAVCLACHDK